MASSLHVEVVASSLLVEVFASSLHVECGFFAAQQHTLSRIFWLVRQTRAADFQRDGHSRGWRLASPLGPPDPGLASGAALLRPHPKTCAGPDVPFKDFTASISCSRLSAWMHG